LGAPVEQIDWLGHPAHAETLPASSLPVPGQSAVELRQFTDIIEAKNVVLTLGSIFRHVTHQECTKVVIFFSKFADFRLRR
jgi:hypothetical protein